MKSSCYALTFLAAMAILLAGSDISFADGVVTFEAESGVLGSDWAVSNSVYITILTDGAGNNPGSAARVATYTVTFPSAGLYQLYARVLVGPGGFNDDSLFYAASFGNKSPTLNSDWVLVNGLAAAGFSNSGDVVTGGGTLGNGIWKWINLSQFTSQSGFTINAGALTQTFQIGARENGLDLDKFAFGTVGTAFTVSNLDTGTIPPPSNINTNHFVGPDGIAVHRFSALGGGLNLDGANPAAGLVLFAGELWGSTLDGGTQGAGTAYYLTLDGANFSSFRSFTNTPDVGNPEGTQATLGTGFLGASLAGGTSGVGTVFLENTNGSVSILRNFAAVSADNATNLGGASPCTQVVWFGNTLYGATTAGGAAANGTLFSLTTNGLVFSILHDFSRLDSQAGTNSDGALPSGGLISDGAKLYGTASAGGAGGNGVVFSMATNGANFTTLYSFSAMDTLAATNMDGAMPLGGLVLSSNTLYGTTSVGGQGGCGTIFSIQTNGSGFTVLHNFTPTDPVTATNADGASPVAALLLSSNLLYGTAAAGGAGAAGTVFALNLASLQFTTIHSFAPVAASGTNTDGAFPMASLLKVGGLLYGTTFGGGPGAAGTVYSVPIPAPPAVITIVNQNLNGTFTLSFFGAPNSTNIIQTTVNLTPPVNWQNVSTNIADANGAWLYSDNNTAVTRYYRSYSR